MEFVAIASIVTVGLVVAAVMYRGKLDPILAGWQSWAEGAGLEYREENFEIWRFAVIEGVLDGYDVAVRLTSARRKRSGIARDTSVEVHLGDQPPAGLQFITSTLFDRVVETFSQAEIESGDEAIDGTLAFYARDLPLGRCMLRTAAVREAFHHWLEDANYASLKGQKLFIQYDGCEHIDVGEKVTAAVGLARALECSVWTPFEQLGEAHGFQLRMRRDRAEVRGRTDDRLDVRVLGQLARKGGAATTIRVEVPWLPEELRVAYRDVGGEPGNVEFTDPIMGRLLAVEAEDPDAARQLLQDDDIRADLLAVVHGHPASTVANGQVMLEVPGVPFGELEELLELALALGRSLRGRL